MIQCGSSGKACSRSTVRMGSFLIGPTAHSSHRDGGTNLATIQPNKGSQRRIVGWMVRIECDSISNGRSHYLRISLRTNLSLRSLTGEILRLGISPPVVSCCCIIFVNHGMMLHALSSGAIMENFFCTLRPFSDLNVYYRINKYCIRRCIGRAT